MRPSLANYWHPLCLADDVTTQPKPFRLLGEGIVAFRDEHGVSAFKDLCIHRGTALSLGTITDGRLTYEYHDSLIIRRYMLYAPFTLHDVKIQRNGDTSVLTIVASPLDEKVSEVYQFTARNHSGATGTKDHGRLKDRAAVVENARTIFEQDRRIIESQRPEEIPTDLRDELHLKVPDASGIAYRRLLSGISGATPFMP